MRGDRFIHCPLGMRRTALLAPLVALVALVGCGDGSHGHPMTDVVQVSSSVLVVGIVDQPPRPPRLDLPSDIETEVLVLDPGLGRGTQVIGKLYAGSRGAGS